MERIYLASPYTHPDPTVREERYVAACQATAHLMRDGDVVFSPIVHSHLLATDYGCPKEFSFWEKWCLSYLEHWATQFLILPLEGWEQSFGVSAEKAVAKKLGLPIHIVIPCTLTISRSNP